MATGGIETRVNKIAGEKFEAEPPPTVSSSTKGETYRSRVWGDLRNLYRQDQLTDVMLAAEGQSIPCHKVSLTAASKFFHDKFITHPESLEHSILDIESIDFSTLTSVVSFIYGGDIELTIEKTEKLIPASVSLMLPELLDECKTFLENLIKTNASASITVYRIAKANSLQDSTQKAWEIMVEKFQEITATAAFQEMSETEVEEYIKDKGLNVANEDPVFEAVVNWIRHDIETRNDKFEKLMENVTLFHCTLRFLGDVVIEEPLVKTGNCFKDVAKALHQHAQSPSLQMGTPRAHAGIYTRSSNALLAVCGNQYYIWREEESNWVQKSLPGFEKLRESSVCFTCDGIVFTGGISNRYHGYKVRQSWKLSFPTMDCTAVSDLRMARSDHASVCVGGQVYVLGGYGPSNSISGGLQVLQSVEYWNVKTGSWTFVTNDMPSNLSSHSAVNYKHYIYVFGGVKDLSLNKSRQSFVLDTVSKKWSRKSDMLQYCRQGSSVVYGDRIYVLGGGEKCCMSYNPDRDLWQSHAKPRQNHAGGSAVKWGDRILLCGGRDTTVIEEYNPHTDTWTEWKHSLPQKRGLECHTVFAIHL